MTHQATQRQSATTGIKSELKMFGEKMRLIAQLLNYAMHTVRIMNGAQPWLERGKNN